MATISPPHAASLATTAGITAVITGVIATAYGGLILPQAAFPTARGAAVAFAAATWALYEARNALGEVMDGAHANPAQAERQAARALALFHFGMGWLFLGLTLAAVWRVAGPLGGGAWGAPLVTFLGGLAALHRFIRHGWEALRPRKQPD